MKYSIVLSVLQWQLLKCNQYHERYLFRILSHLFIPSSNECCTSSCFFLLHMSIFSFSIHSCLPSQTPGSQNVKGLEGLTEGNRDLRDFQPSRPLLFPSMDGEGMDTRNQATALAGCCDLQESTTTPAQGMKSPEQLAPSPLFQLQALPVLTIPHPRSGLGTFMPHHFCLKCPQQCHILCKAFLSTFPPQNRIHSF